MENTVNASNDRYSLNYRLNLDDIVKAYKYWRMPATAAYFASLANDPCTVDGWIEAGVVKRHLMLPGEFNRSDWSQIQQAVRFKPGLH
jgi:hypothetical protein